MPQPQSVETNLIARFRAGDPEAFELLIRRHHDALAARARSHLGARVRKRVSVADVVQDAELVAFEHRADFRGDGDEALRGWLLGIVANRARKAVHRHLHAAVRSVGREVSGVTRPSSLGLQSPEGTPSQEAAIRELTALAARARVVLSREEDRLLELVHDEGLSLREAAARLGRSYEATRKQHARALRRLGRAVQQL